LVVERPEGVAVRAGGTSLIARSRSGLTSRGIAWPEIVEFSPTGMLEETVAVVASNLRAAGVEV
jgi:hypothetical protein